MRRLPLAAAGLALAALPLGAGEALAGGWGCDCDRRVYGYGAVEYGYGAPVYAYPAGRTYGYAYAPPVYGYYGGPSVVVVAPPAAPAPTAYGYYGAPAYGYAYETRRRGFLGIDW